MRDQKVIVEVRCQVVLAILENSQHRMTAAMILKEATPLSEWILSLQPQQSLSGTDDKE